MRWNLAISTLCLILATACSSQPGVTAGDVDSAGHVEIGSAQTFDVVLSDDYPASNSAAQ